MDQYVVLQMNSRAKCLKMFLLIVNILKCFKILLTIINPAFKFKRVLKIFIKRTAY